MSNNEEQFPCAVGILMVGDFIRHPDDGKLYRVESVILEDAYLDDGSVIDLDDITEILLESEGFDEFESQVR